MEGRERIKEKSQWREGRNKGGRERRRGREVGRKQEGTKTWDNGIRNRGANKRREGKGADKAVERMREKIG